MLEINPKVNAWFVRSPGGKLEGRWRDLEAVSLGVLTKEQVEFLVKRLGEDVGAWGRWGLELYLRELFGGDGRRAGRALSLIGRFSGSEKLHRMPIRRGDVIITVNQRGRFRVAEVIDEKAQVILKPPIRGQFFWRRVRWKIAGSFTLQEVSGNKGRLKRKFKAGGPIVRVSEFLITPLARELFPLQAREYEKSIHPTVEEVLEHLGFREVEPLMRVQGEVFDYLYFRHDDQLLAVLVYYPKHFWALFEEESFSKPGKLIRKEHYYKPDIEELLSKENLTIDDILKFY